MPSLRAVLTFACVVAQSVPDATNVGILLPTTFHNEFDDAEFLAPECRTGTVVAMGPGRLAKDGSRVPMPPLEIGQKVVVGPAKGERVELFGQSLQDSTHFLFTPEEVGGHALCSQSWSGECARNSSSSSSSKRRRDAVANSAAETDVHPCLRHARNVRRLRGTQPACDAQLVALSLLSCPLRCGPQIRLDGMIYFKQTASVPLRTERKRTCPSHIRTH